ncbi:MAG: class I SAM-dependent methyltransferase [Chloroflexi bacterium]|nr:class I SAM-dependent methyltransferase [Chloroflexota bacterium]
MADQKPDVEKGKLSEIESHYRNLYTKEAVQYDATRFNHERGQHFNTKEQQAIHKLLDLPAGNTLLDVPTGTGRIGAYMAEQGLQVTGFDITRNMMLEARKLAESWDLGNKFVFVEGNGRELPFPTASFDGVMSIRFFHLLPTPLHRPFVVDMWRVVKPGGTLLIQYDSALTGGGLITWPREAHRRLIKKHKPRYYFWPHQLASVFEGIPYEVHGFSVPGSRFLSAKGADFVENLVATGVKGFLANRVFIKAVKPL